MSDYLPPHRLQYMRLLCPPLSPGVCSYCSFVHWSMMPSNHLILCYLLLLLPSIFPSIKVFSSELALCIRWPKYWSFSFSNSPSCEYSGLMSFRVDWFDLLAVPGTLKSLLPHHNLKVFIVWCSGFFMIPLTSVHDYWTNHSFDYMDFCWHSDVSAFQHAV